MGGNDELLDCRHASRGITLTDDYFVEAQSSTECRLLHRPDLQVDGFPGRMFTVLLPSIASGLDRPVARMIEDPATKIGSPRQVCIGETERDYVALSDR